MTIAEKKISIFNQVQQVNNVELLEQVERLLQKLFAEENEHLQYVKPMRKVTNIEDILKNQGHKKISQSEWDELVKELDLQETAEELIAQLSA